MIRTRTSLLAAIALAAATFAAPALADEACQVDSLLREVATLDDWGVVEMDQWVGVSRADGSRAASGPKSVAKDGTVVSLRYTRQSAAVSLVPTTSFVFKPTWPLNPKFTFEPGDRILVRGIRKTDDGKDVYVLAGRQSGSRVLFATMDGTLCNRVINPGRPRPNFLNGTYSSTPGGKLVPDKGLTSDEMTVKVVYLGASAGTVKYREVWSIGGKVVADETLEFDNEASEVEVGGLTLVQSNPTASAVKITTPAIPERIEPTKKIGRYLRLRSAD